MGLRVAFFHQEATRSWEPVKLPGGAEIHRLREQGLTYDAIGQKFDASRQAAYKVHKTWAERNGKEFRTRPVRNSE